MECWGFGGLGLDILRGDLSGRIRMCCHSLDSDIQFVQTKSCHVCLSWGLWNGTCRVWNSRSAGREMAHGIDFFFSFSSWLSELFMEKIEILVRGRGRGMDAPLISLC